MATDGLSLVGFMDQNLAIKHLKNQCKLPDNSDAALTAEWQRAIAKLGAAVANAGHPDIRPLSTAEQASLMSQPSLTAALATLPGARFALVEIDPLLAYTFTIDNERAAHHCRHLGAHASFDDLAKCCLPTAPVHDSVQQFLQNQSALIKSRSLNMQIGLRGIFSDAKGPNAMGVRIELALPLTHVVRLNGKCYMHNGFHRALGLRRAGITHIPCIFREASDAADAGIKNPEATFQLPLLESANPPTLAHFTRGSALSVRLRAASKILQVSWSEYVVYDE